MNQGIRQKKKNFFHLQYSKQRFPLVSTKYEMLFKGIFRGRILLTTTTTTNNYVYKTYDRGITKFLDRNHHTETLTRG